MARFGLQLTVIIVGGAVAGGLLLLATIPTSVEVPWPLPAAAAAVALWCTGRATRRLEPDH